MEFQVSDLFFTFNERINISHQTDGDDIYAQKITEHRYKLIYTMCQPIKVMDYLESTGVIPRSLCSRIYYVSDQISAPSYTGKSFRNIEYPKIVIVLWLISSIVEQNMLIDLWSKHSISPVNFLHWSSHCWSLQIFVLGNDHLVELLDGSFFLSNVRQQLDSAYRFPTALAQQTTVPTSFEDAKIRSMNTNLDFEDNRLSILDLKDIEATKYDDELPMGFSIQLLTDEVLEQYPQLDPQKRPIKVCDYLVQLVSWWRTF